MFGMDHSWARRFKCVQIKSLGSSMAHLRGLNFDIVLYIGKCLKNLLQPNLVGHMLGRWGIRFVQIKGVAPFGAQ